MRISEWSSDVCSSDLLRVWNDDLIAAGSGFPPHPHNNMEIITYVRSSAITHRDSMGNEGRTEAGDVQERSAGTGVRHSEYNLENKDTTLFQIWIIPDQRGGEPSWGARKFPKDDRAGQFVPLASGKPGDGDALPIRADARVLGASVRAGESVTYEPADAGRHHSMVPAHGQLRLDDVQAHAPPGLALTGRSTITVPARETSVSALISSGCLFTPKLQTD